MTTSIYSNANNTELERKVNNLLREGVIAQVNENRVRVRIGQLLTTWLRWFNLRAAAVHVSSKPTIGEQCLVLSAGGNLGGGLVLLGLNSDANPMPQDCGPNDLILEVPTDGRLVLRCGNSSVVMTADHIEITATRIDFNEE